MKLILNDKVKYVLFDMDGTLLDTMTYWRNAAADFLVKKGYAKPTPELFISLQGEHLYDTLLKYFRDHGITDTVSYEEFYSIVVDGYNRSAPVREGVTEMLDDLRTRGLGMCIVTLTPFFMVEKALSHSGISEYFRFVHSTSGFTPDKSFPEFYQKAVGWFGGTHTEELAVVEDTYENLAAAKEAGCYTVGIREYFELYRQTKVMSVSDEYVPMNTGIQRKLSLDYFTGNKFTLL